MSAEKRKVSTDALETLGMLIDETAGRDAIHLAVEPMMAGELLQPGQRVGIKDGYASTKADKLLGIVDPFLDHPVPRGKMFWLIVFPRQITSLRHVWSHPDFPEEVGNSKDSIDDSRLWIEGYASRLGLSDGQTLIDAADTYVDHGEYLSEGDLLEGISTDDDFWFHYEVVTGRPVGNRGNFFRCAC